MDKESSSHLPIDLGAAQLAVEWKELFATELRLAARQLAVNNEIVTSDHYRRALASAMASLLHTVNSHRIESPDVRRQSA